MTKSSDTVREAYVEGLGIKTGGKLLNNLRNAEDIAFYTTDSAG